MPFSLAVQRIGDALFEELDRVGPLPVRRRLADRARADDELDVPVVGAPLLAVRVAVGALEDAASAFCPRAIVGPP